MKAHTYLPENEMIRRALDALVAALGPVETIRFLTMPQQRRLNSIARHRQWQASLDKEQFLDQVFGPAERLAS